MAPKYLAENRCAFVIDGTRDLARASYEVDSPETAFQRDVQRRLVTANRLMANGRPAAALDEYLSLRGLIAAVLYPKIPPYVGVKAPWRSLAQAGLADAVLANSAQMLERTPPLARAIPDSISAATELSPAVATLFSQVEALGLVDADADAGIGVALSEMQSAFDKGDFKGAATVAAEAAQLARDPELRAALLHDQALQERGGEPAQAIAVMERSIAASMRPAGARRRLTLSPRSPACRRVRTTPRVPKPRSRG